MWFNVGDGRYFISTVSFLSLINLHFAGQSGTVGLVSLYRFEYAMICKLSEYMHNVIFFYSKVENCSYFILCL